MVRALLPEAEITTRPRFSTLSYVGPAKLSRLPPRSAIVAFSAEQVYAVAEMLRRMRGGAAVVMGALSPRTRNAQVAMYQAGEVDYLVATDAIGMGLNMDVDHVAFAGLTKFDGQRRRRLTPAEMAQIAGRAGRHQRDGTFGSLTLEGDALAEFRPEEIERIEEHRFAPLDFLYWRESELDFRSVEDLIRSLERRPVRREVRAAPEAIDLAVLKLLSADPEILARADHARAGAPALGRLRPARFPQDRARASQPPGRPPLRPSGRGRRPHPAGLVCRAGRPARQCPGRHRHARRPDRRGAHLGLYRPPRRLARRTPTPWPSAPWRWRRSSPTRCTSA